jgi:hypothetical protein
MIILNSHFLRPFATRSRDVSGDGQSVLVDKLGVRPSRSRLPRPTSLIAITREFNSRPKAAVLRRQSYPIITTNLPIY